MHIYLDNAATTKPSEEVVDAMLKCSRELYGNPSSAHIMGVEAEKIIKEAREKVARLLGAKPSEIIFTSGGTESNNMAVKGASRARQKQGRHIITTAIEHPSVLKSCQDLTGEGFELTVLGVDPHGYVSLEELVDAIRPDTVLVSVMHVNNETGAIQPIADIGRAIKAKNPETIFHVDAVESFGKLNVKPARWQVDLLSASGHKIYGPKGVGALYIREGVRIKPLISGGGQEFEMRSGTENVPGIAGFGVAAAKAAREMAANHDYMVKLHDYLVQGLLNNIPDIKINSPVDGAPHILNVSFRGVKGEVLLHTLEARGIYISTGSACSSRKFTASHVLQSMKLDRSELAGSIRFSFCVENTLEELASVITELIEATIELRKYARR